jgi:hypothetical protein
VAEVVVVVTFTIATVVWLYYELYFSGTIQTIHQSLREFPCPYISCELRLIPYRETDVYSLTNETVAKTLSPFMLQASYHR